MVTAPILSAALLVPAYQVTLVTDTFVLVSANFILNETLFDFVHLVTFSLCLIHFTLFCFLRFLDDLTIILILAFNVFSQSSC